MSESPQTIASAHALILNRLHEMQRAPYYATARDELSLAESTIASLEAEVLQWKRELEIYQTTESAEVEPLEPLTDERSCSCGYGCPPFCGCRYDDEVELKAAKHERDYYERKAKHLAAKLMEAKAWRESILSGYNGSEAQMSADHPSPELIAFREDDGDMNIEVFIDHDNMVSISISPDGAFNWAGSINGVSQHAYDPPSDLGRLLFKLIDKGATHD